VLSPDDARREHLAVHRDEDALWVSWNVDSSSESNPDATYVLLMIEFSIGGGAGARAGDMDSLRVFKTEAELKGADEEELKRRLMLSPPVEIRAPRIIQMKDDFRMLTYVYDEDEARRQLAHYYAMSVDLSDHEIRKVARAMSVTFDRAKAMLYLKYRQSRDDFVEKSLSGYLKKTAGLLESVFVRQLTGEINSLAIVEWDNPEINISKNAQQIHKELLQEQREETARRLGMPGRGRRRGTSPRVGREKILARDRQKLAQIRAAMEEIFRRKLAEKKIDTRTLSAAEDTVTPAAVCKKLTIDRKTLTRRLVRGGVSFEALRDFVAREETRRLNSKNHTE
jgi:hypothetical protein